MLRFVQRRAIELVITAAALIVGVGILARVSTEWGIGILAAALFGSVFALAFAEGQRMERERHDAAIARDDAEAELAEMRTIAELARAILLEATVWRDIDEWRAGWQAEGASLARKVVPSLEWSVAAIVARGRDALKPLEVRGWSQIADLIREHAQYLINRIDQEFPGPPAERRTELTTLFRAAEQAASGAQDLATARSRMTELYFGGTSDEKERAREAVRAAADLFFGACEWIQGCVEKLDDRPDVAASIAQAAERHRADAAAILEAQREIQDIAATSALSLLKNAAPAPEYLERSIVGSATATLREIAQADSFAFAASEEEAALGDWIGRIRRAQRSFHEAVMDRGGEMHERTHTLWVRIHNDSVLELEKTIQGLAGDVHAQTDAPANLAKAIAANVAERRAELRVALQRLVERVDELQALQLA